MIPIAAISSGAASVEVIEPYATGYAVHAITSTKISQTWFASHTGPIACLASSRIRRAEAEPPTASSVHSPAPKSAPASTVYAVIPARMNATGT